MGLCSSSPRPHTSALCRELRADRKAGRLGEAVARCAGHHGDLTEDGSTLYSFAVEIGWPALQQQLWLTKQYDVMAPSAAGMTAGDIALHVGSPLSLLLFLSHGGLLPEGDLPSTHSTTLSAAEWELSIPVLHAYQRPACESTNRLAVWLKHPERDMDVDTAFWQLKQDVTRLASDPPASSVPERPPPHAPPKAGDRVALMNMASGEAHLNGAMGTVIAPDDRTMEGNVNVWLPADADSEHTTPFAVSVAPSQVRPAVLAVACPPKALSNGRAEAVPPPVY